VRLPFPHVRADYRQRTLRCQDSASCGSGTPVAGSPHSPPLSIIPLSVAVSGC